MRRGWRMRSGILTRGTGAKDRYATAIHEAAHAVVAHRLSACVEWTKLHPKNPWRGWTQITYTQHKVGGKWRVDPLEVALVCTAGHAAESLILGRPPRWLPKGDYRHAWLMGITRASVDATTFLAKRIVRQHQSDIRKVAKVLMREGEVDRRRFLRALRGGKER